MEGLIQRFLAKLVILLASSLLSATLQAKPTATAQTASNALNAVDAYFVEQYNADNLAVGRITKPLMIVDGFSYKLYLPDGKQRSFNGLVSPFNELKAISHIGPALYAIGEPAWRNSQDKSWISKLTTYHKLIRQALREVNSVDWRNAAWPGKQQQLATFMQQSLQLVDKFIGQILQKGVYTQQDYTDFANQYLHTMVATMYMADLANTTYVINQLKQWRQQLGQAQWDNMYVLVMGSKGRSTAGLTIKTNTAADTIAHLMKSDKVPTHLIIMPRATNMDEALATLGTIINAGHLANLTFTTPAAKQESGLYQALKQPGVPLALDNVKQIIFDSLLNGMPTTIPSLELPTQPTQN